jgi:hypothetical protein
VKALVTFCSAAFFCMLACLPAALAQVPNNTTCRTIDGCQNVTCFSDPGLCDDGVTRYVAYDEFSFPQNVCRPLLTKNCVVGGQASAVCEWTCWTTKVGTDCTGQACIILDLEQECPPP